MTKANDDLDRKKKILDLIEKKLPSQDELESTRKDFITSIERMHKYALISNGGGAIVSLTVINSSITSGERAPYVIIPLIIFLIGMFVSGFGLSANIGIHADPAMRRTREVFSAVNELIKLGSEEKNETVDEIKLIPFEKTMDEVQHAIRKSYDIFVKSVYLSLIIFVFGCVTGVGVLFVKLAIGTPSAG